MTRSRITMLRGAFNEDQPAKSLTVGLLVGANGAEQAAQATDEKKLQGEWYWVSAEVNGAKKPADDFEAKQVLTVIQGDKMQVVHKGKAGQESIFRLDAAKNPKEIDLE